MRRISPFIVAALSLAVAAPASAATFNVNSIGDLGDTSPGNGACWTGGLVLAGTLLRQECTLRAAIQEANALAGADTIQFANYIPTDGNGFVRIQPGSGLTAITSEILLDGETAPGYDSGNPNAVPVVQIDGSFAGSVAGIVVLGATGSVIRAVAVHGFGDDGVVLTNDGNLVQGCHIGISSGSFADGNSGDGIYILSGADGNTIGQECGDATGCTGRGNVISANGGHGIEVLGRDTRIAGNRIGTHPDGNGIWAVLDPTGNTLWGIRAQKSTLLQGTIIGDVGYGTGGIVVPSGNLISGNLAGGILLESDGNLVRANQVGTTVSGTGNAGNFGPGIEIDGSQNVIGDVSGETSNVVSWNDDSGIVIGSFGGDETDGNLVVGNFIGTDANATLVLPNDQDGVEVRGGLANRIDSNTISGNASDGVSGSAPLTEIVGNYIGTSAASANLGNAGHGVITQGVSWRIGTEAAGESNVIGFNGDRGILIGGGAAGTSVQANYVGTDPQGNDLGNVDRGIQVSGTDNFIGGAMGNDEGNIVGFNAFGIFTTNTTGPSWIRGNFVGTNPSGDDLGNDSNGVHIGSSSDQMVGDMSIPGGENVIAFNKGSGVEVFGVGAMDNPIRGNSIHSNVGLGIDLDPVGVNGNDPGDVDTGANGLQNGPVLEAALSFYDSVPNQVTIGYSVDASTSHATYPLAIDFYVADPSGQGRSWIGEASYNAPGATDVVTFTPAPGVNVLLADVVGTATDRGPGALGNTSEFSQRISLPEPSGAAGLAACVLLLRTLASRRRCSESEPKETASADGRAQ